MRASAQQPVRIGSGLGALLQVGAGLAVTALLLAMLEFGAGFFVEAPHPQEILGDTVSRTVTWLELNPAPLVRDVDLLWRNQPGARKTQPVNPRPFGREDTWTIENNSEGFRGPERVATGSGRKVFRILCVGDSVTFGFSVDQPDTYPQRLLELLERRYPTGHFEVVNTGVPGWSWLQGLEFLESRGLAMQPDLIVIGHGTNDQLFPAKVTDEERFRKLAGPVRRSFEALALYAAETNTYRAIARLLPPRPLDDTSPGCREQIRLFGGCHRVSVDQIAATVHEVARLAAGAGMDLLVVNTDFVQTAAVQGTRRGAERDQVSFLDLVEELDRRSRADEDLRSERLGLAKAPEPAAETDQAATGPKRVVLRVLAPDATRTYRVVGLAYFQPGYAFAEPAYDDATHGDERAGDGVFSATLEVPAEIQAIEYQFHQGDIAEFTSLPPLASTLGDRVLRTPASRVGPVDLFGQSLFMVERAHPNRDGHQLIAQLIADKLEDLPAFRNYVRGTNADAAAPRAVPLHP